MAVARLALDSRPDGAVRLSDEVELYQRTYTTLLRSSGETHLGCSSPRTAPWARACTLWRPARSSTSAPSSTRSAACPTGSSAPSSWSWARTFEALVAAGMPVDVLAGGRGAGPAPALV